MTQLDTSNVDTGNPPRYETPTFEPRGAFAWTLRSGEIALRERRRRQNRAADPSELTSDQPAVARQVDAPPARCYQTPTFHPRGMFARTLRSGEVARLERRKRLSAAQPDVLVGSFPRTLSEGETGRATAAAA